MKILIPAAAAIVLCTASASLAQGPQERPERGGGQERGGARADPGNRGGGEMRGRAERADPRAQRAEPRMQRETPRAERAEGSRAERAEGSRAERAERRGERSRERAQRDERPDRQAVERRERQDAARQRSARSREDRADERRQSERRQDRSERSAERNRDRDRVQAQDRRTRVERRDTDVSRRDQDRRQSIREARTHFTADQRTRFRSSFDRRHVTNVRFTARIGTRIPRSVRLYAIPAAVIGLVPAYSYYRYVYVDDTICIVDPTTYEVVDVIEYGSDGPAVIEARLELTAAERAILLDSISADFPETDISLRLALGADIPGRVELHTFPDVLVDRIPKLRGYRFVVSDGDVVIVGARSREIQLVVRR